MPVMTSFHANFKDYNIRLKGFPTFWDLEDYNITLKVKLTNVKTEFVDTIRGALDKYAEGQPNMASEAARDEIAESVEQEIRSKFHIFRINRILTED